MATRFIELEEPLLYMLIKGSIDHLKIDTYIILNSFVHRLHVLTPARKAVLSLSNGA